MATKDEMTVKDERAAKAAENVSQQDAEKMDLVQMAKDGELVAVEPWNVESKKGLGFEVVGTVDADGKVTGTVVATPAHLYMDAEGYLRVIPDYYKVVAPK